MLVLPVTFYQDPAATDGSFLSHHLEIEVVDAATGQACCQLSLDVAAVLSKQRGRWEQRNVPLEGREEWRPHANVGVEHVCTEAGIRKVMEAIWEARATHPEKHPTVHKNAAGDELSNRFHGPEGWYTKALQSSQIGHLPRRRRVHRPVTWRSVALQGLHILGVSRSCSSLEVYVLF